MKRLVAIKQQRVRRSGYDFEKEEKKEKNKEKILK